MNTNARQASESRMSLAHLDLGALQRREFDDNGFDEWKCIEESAQSGHAEIVRTIYFPLHTAKISETTRCGCGRSGSGSRFSRCLGASLKYDVGGRSIQLQRA